MTVLPDMGQVWNELALTHAEIETYELLLRTGPSSASAVAKLTRASRGRSYQTLRSLVERGLVRENPVEPVEYAPVHPSEVVGLILASSQQRLRGLQALLEETAKVTLEHDVRAHGAEPPQASVLKSRRAAQAEIRRRIDSARKRLWLAGGPRFFARLAATKGLAGAIQGRINAGVDVALLIPANPAGEALPPLDIRGARVATLPAARPMTVDLVVSDTSGLLVVPSPDDDSAQHGDDFALRLDGPMLAQALADWMSALVSEHAPQPSAGHAPEQVRPEIIGAVASAKTTARVLGPPAWLQAIEHETDLRNALLAAASRGVRVCLVTEFEPSLWAWLQPLLGHIDVKVVRSAAVAAVLVDGAQSFVGLESGDGYLIRSTRDDFESRHLESLFSRSWEKGVPLAL